MLVVYGLKNCDICRRARKWLDAEGIAHTFQDVRADGLDANTVAKWTKALGWEALVNTRGTTWRGLPEATKKGLNAKGAAKLMLEHPALIKRPVFDLGGSFVLGFKEEHKQAIRDAGA